MNNGLPNGPNQWAILRHFIKYPDSQTVQNLFDALQGNIDRATIRTTCDKMVKSGYLEKIKDGNSTFYKPVEKLDVKLQQAAHARMYG